MIQGLTGSAELVALTEGIRYIHLSEVEGAVAEFGCYKGKSAQALAFAIGCYRPLRHLWLFDSFKGLPDATDPVDAESPNVVSGSWTWKADISTDEVRKLCEGSVSNDYLHITPGWFNDTIYALKSPLALVHVDCDLYESTFTVLSYLFRERLLSDGCAIFFDDWYCNRANPKWGEQRAWAQVLKHGYTFTDWGPYGLMGRKFLIHEV